VRALFTIPPTTITQTANTVATVQGTETVANASVKAQVREAFAQMQPSDAVAATIGIKEGASKAAA
jgi:hypothetical protein